MAWSPARTSETIIRLTHGTALKDDVYLDAVQNLISYLVENSLRRNSLVNAADMDNAYMSWQSTRNA
jgi:hypothetical protein